MEEFKVILMCAFICIFCILFMLVNLIKKNKIKKSLPEFDPPKNDPSTQVIASEEIDSLVKGLTEISSLERSSTILRQFNNLCHLYRTIDTGTDIESIFITLANTNTTNILFHKLTRMDSIMEEQSYLDYITYIYEQTMFYFTTKIDLLKVTNKIDEINN